MITPEGMAHAYDMGFENGMYGDRERYWHHAELQVWYAQGYHDGLVALTGGFNDERLHETESTSEAQRVPYLH